LKEIVKNDTPVYLALDSDAEVKSIEIIKELLKYGLEVHKIDTTGYAGCRGDV
jgi:ACT domain-containing protein